MVGVCSSEATLLLPPLSTTSTYIIHLKLICTSLQQQSCDANMAPHGRRMQWCVHEAVRCVH